MGTSARNSPPFPSSLLDLRLLVPSSTPSSSLPPLPTPLLFSTLLPTLVAPWVNGSETTADTPSSSSMICPSRLLPTDRCPSFSDDLQDEKPTPVMSSTSTLDSSSEQPRCLTPLVPVPSPLSPSSRPRLVMSPLTSQPTSFPLPMDRSSWRTNFSLRVSDPLSTSVFPSPESVPPPR